MFKGILFKIIYYLSLSGYNTFYKYMMVNENSYFLNDGFMKMYKSSSNSVSYLNIFVLSNASLFVVDFLINVFVFYISKRPFKEVFNNISCYFSFLIFVFIAYGLLFLNTVLSLTILVIGFGLYMFEIKKRFSKNCFWVIFLFDLFNFVCLYFISS